MPYVEKKTKKRTDLEIEQEITYFVNAIKQKIKHIKK